MLGSLGTAPLPVILVILSFLMPTELSLFVGPLRLPPHRAALIIFVLVALIRLLSGRGPSVRSFDVVFALYAAWTVGVFIIHEGTASGIEFGGALALEAFGAYFVARVYVTDERRFRATLSWLLAAVAIAGAIALPETLFGRHYVHEFLHKVTGYYHPIAYEKRLGLTRAYGTFDHPILYGTFCASVLAMLWFAGGGWIARLLRAGLVGLATLFGLSSAPILCLLTQGALIGWERATRGTPGRITLMVAALTLVYVVVDAMSNRGALEAIVTSVTLDPWTAYYRIQIWVHGLENVAREPLIGIGLADWSRAWWMSSASVDAFWLLIMMRAGIPALLLLLLAIGLQMAGIAGATRGADASVRALARGWVISMVALGLLGLTVHYWNALHAYLFFVVGMGAWMASARETRPVRAVEGHPAAVRRMAARAYAPAPRPRPA
ncbi:MAG: hypothetical protein GC150_00110 [Rhizobiales bacterium]|nr:hypothetical protein [Hyphomicrobiales bacterium]